MKILIPVDDYLFAAAIENRLQNFDFGKKPVFRLLRVFAPSELMENWPSEIYRDDAKRMFVELESALCNRFPGAIVEKVLVDGFVEEEILNNASRWPADLIVMGNHGRHGLPRLVMGSVSSVISMKASCPVMTVRLVEQPAKSVQKRRASAAK